jgi:hypothetical protein
MFVSLPSFFSASEVINFPASHSGFYLHNRYKNTQHKTSVKCLTKHLLFPCMPTADTKHNSENFSLMPYQTLVISLHAHIRYKTQFRKLHSNALPNTCYFPACPQRHKTQFRKLQSNALPNICYFPACPRQIRNTIQKTSF